MRSLGNIIRRFPEARILVFGDLILDDYIWGDVERISPEAPVPVVWAKRRSYMPGGAANVANNIKSLGAYVCLSGLVGQDKNAQILLAALKEKDIHCRGIFFGKRHTTVKTRVIAGHQQVVRVDWEDVDSLSRALNLKLYDFIKKNIKKFDALIIEDYGKGVINPYLIERIISLAKSAGKIITVDPKEEHFQYYKGVTGITPNRKEAENAVRKLKIQDTTNTFKINTDRLEQDAELNLAGKELLNYLKLDSLLITLGEKGMRLFQEDRIIHIPTQAQEVFDVSGAGDTVIATFTLALACGATKLEAAHIANFAAGIVVGKLGTAVTTRKELLERISKI